jgi:hypothetical protein
VYLLGINDSVIIFENYIIFLLGGFSLNEEYRLNMIDFLATLLPIIIFLYLTAKFMLEDFAISSIYVFTRNGSKTLWYFKQIYKIFYLAIIFTLIRILTVLIFGYLLHLKIDNFDNFITILLFIIILNVLVLFVLSLLINIVSLKFNVTIGYIVSYGLLTISSLIPVYSKGIIRIAAAFSLPSNQMMLRFHDLRNLEKILNFSSYIKDFSVNYSIVYLCVFSLVLVSSGYFIIRKLDILNFEW